MALSSIEINRILNRTLSRTHYVGALSYEELPKRSISEFPWSVVINTAPTRIKYGHWTAIYGENLNQCAYFDSLGIEPWGAILEFLKKNFRNAVYNTRLIQNPASENCGLYCVDFVNSLDKKVPLEVFMQRWSGDTISNGIKVTKSINDLIENIKL